MPEGTADDRSTDAHGRDTPPGDGRQPGGQARPAARSQRHARPPGARGAARRRHGPPADDHRRRAPGSGSSTLAARVARTRNAAWYTVDAIGPPPRHVRGRGRRGAPRGLPRRSPRTSRTPIATADRPDATTRRPSSAARPPRRSSPTRSRTRSTTSSLLVLDDTPRARRRDRLVAVRRGARPVRPGRPPRRSLVSRNDPPFGVERLRGQGEVVGHRRRRARVHGRRDRDARCDAPARRRRARATRPRDRRGPDPRATNGWPAAVRLTIEALRARAGGRPRGGPRPAPAPGGPAVRVPRRGGRRRPPPTPSGHARPGRPLRPVLGAAARGGRRRRRDARRSTGSPAGRCSSSRCPASRAGSRSTG